MENNPLCQLHKTEELCRLSVQQNGCSLKIKFYPNLVIVAILCSTITIITELFILFRKN